MEKNIIKNSNMECIICSRKFEKNILFEDNKILMMLAIEPSVNGHIQIFSKEHYTIFEQLPEDVINSLISAANKMSIILFEALKVHGTNIIISNGVSAGQKIPHFSIDIIPRRTDDDLKLDWTLKQASSESLDSMHRIIEEGMNRQNPNLVDTKLHNKEFDDADTSISISNHETLKVAQDMPNTHDAIKVSDNNKDKSSNDDEEYEDKTNYYHQLLERIP
jgi:diadenosine tetraphosphate (Ap4A) HIT family hydrolase